jgi:hypothetical protein
MSHDTMKRSRRQMTINQILSQLKTSKSGVVTMYLLCTIMTKHEKPKKII